MDNAPFKIGQKVVCINNKLLPGRAFLNELQFLEVGKEYIVLDIKIPKSDWAIKVATISVSGMPGVNFCSSRFTPIEEQREKIRYVAVSETLREKAIEIAAIETN